MHNKPSCFYSDFDVLTSVDTVAGSINVQNIIVYQWDEMEICLQIESLILGRYESSPVGP
jgi:hypothetical protein